MSGSARTSLLVTLLNAAAQLASFLLFAAIAALYGATVETDAFFLAMTIPALFVGPVVNSIHSVFVPVITASRIRHPDRTGPLVGSAVGWLGLSAIMASVAFGVAAPPIVRSLGGDLVAGEQGLVVRYMVLLLPLIAAQTVCGLLAAAYNADGKFLFPAIAFTLRHVSALSALLVFGVRLGTDALPVAFVFGALVQLGLLLSRSGTLSFSIPVGLRVDDEFRRSLGLAVPLLISSVVLQAGTFVTRFFASRLPVGSVTVLDYASRITSAVIELLMSGVLLVSMVNWSELVARESADQLRASLRRAVLLVMFIILPVTVVLFASRVPVIELLLGRGHLDPSYRLLTAGVLGFLLIGLPLEVVARLYLRVFLAWHSTRILAWLALVRLGSLTLLAIALLRGLGVKGLAFADSLSIGCYLVTLILVARGRLHGVFEGTYGPLGRVGVAAMCAWLLAAAATQALAAMPAVVAVTVAGLLGLGGYVACCRLLKVPELPAVVHALAWRGQARAPLAPDDSWG